MLGQHENVAIVTKNGAPAAVLERCGTQVPISQLTKRSCVKKDQSQLPDTSH